MHGSELIWYVKKFAFFPYRTEWCNFHKFPDFSCSRCVKKVFYSAFVWKCTDVCNHRFGVQLLQNPPLCSSTSSRGARCKKYLHKERFHIRKRRQVQQETRGGIFSPFMQMYITWGPLTWSLAYKAAPLYSVPFLLHVSQHRSPTAISQK